MGVPRSSVLCVAITSAHSVIRPYQLYVYAVTSGVNEINESNYELIAASHLLELIAASKHIPSIRQLIVSSNNYSEVHICVNFSCLCRF